MLPMRWRDVVALAVTGLVLAASAVVWYAQQPDIGFTVVERDGRYVVGSVTPDSEAQLMGVRPGAAILAVDDRPFEAAIRALKSDDYPDPVYTVLSSSNSIGIETEGGGIGLDLRHDATFFQVSIVEFLLGILLLVGGLFWLAGGRAGAGLRVVAITVACASAMPLLAAPLATWGAPLGRMVAALAPALASLLLADSIISLIASRRRRLATLAAALLAAAAAALLPLLYLLTGVYWEAADAVGWWALLLISLVPMLVVTASRPLPGTPLAGADNPGAAWLIATACTPAVALLPAIIAAPSGWLVWWLVPVWVAILVVWRAVSRRIARARLQRDLVVTVTEAERARLAAELHDVALQELTLLVRRLDASGDEAAASMARSVSDRLRELCGELHLPILDELGAGPALEWLVGQVAAATQEDIRLERADEARPPASVELAVFRVAQEAIANAVKHGSPPIVVRYVTSPTAASLSVDDAGPGLDIGRGPIAPKPGHFGLASMQQRAEQIGALLSIRAWPGGGTRVSLEWKAP